MKKSEIAARKDALLDKLLAEEITKEQYKAAVAELELGYNITPRGLFEMDGLKSKIHIKELALIPDLLPKIAAFVAKNYVTIGEPIHDEADTAEGKTDAAPASSEAPAETKVAA